MLVLAKYSLTRMSLVITTCAILFGPLYSEPQYDWVTHTVSQLGAQSTRNSWIMVTGFLVLGIGLVVDIVRFRDVRMALFGLFGLFFALAGCFPHQAWIEGRPSSGNLHLMHQIMANLSGLAITAAHLVTGFTAETVRRRSVSTILAMSCLILPLAMFQFQNYTGVIQRIMYGASFWWLWKNCPKDRRSK